MGSPAATLTTSSPPRRACLTSSSTDATTFGLTARSTTSARAAASALEAPVRTPYRPASSSARGTCRSVTSTCSGVHPAVRSALSSVSPITPPPSTATCGLPSVASSVIVVLPSPPPEGRRREPTDAGPVTGASARIRGSAADLSADPLLVALARPRSALAVGEARRGPALSATVEHELRRPDLVATVAAQAGQALVRGRRAGHDRLVVVGEHDLVTGRQAVGDLGP